MKSFLDWLRGAISKLDDEFDLLDIDPFHVEALFETAGSLAREAGERALAVGLIELYRESLDFIGPCDDDVAKEYLGKCIATCLAQLPGEKPPESEWLSAEEAAPLLGVCVATVKEWCNYIDPKTGKYAPRIVHLRVGECGRPNMKNGRRGKIKIHRDVVAKFVADRTAEPLATPTAKPRSPKRQPFRSSYFSPAGG